MRIRHFGLSALLLLAPLAGSGAAQDEPAEQPEIPQVSARPDGAESTEEWFRFSQQFAEQLQTTGRVREAVEEIFACGALHVDELDMLADGAVLFVEFGGRQPGGLKPGSEYQRIADDMIRTAVLRGGKGDARLAYAIGRIKFAAVDWGTAYRMFRDAREKDWEPSRVDPWYYRAVVNRAPLLLDAMRFDEAVAQLEEVIATQPDHPEVMAAKINLAVAYRKRDERVTSEKILRELVEKYPGNPQPWNTLGQVLFDQGRLEEALEAYRTSISLASALGAPYDEALVSTAHVLYKLGRLEESQRVTENFLRLQRDAPGGLYLMAMLHRDRGETLEAMKVLRRAHRLAPGDTSILTLLQQVHYERDEIEEADEIEKQIAVIQEEQRKQLEPPEGEEGAETGDAAAGAQTPPADPPTED